MGDALPRPRLPLLRGASSRGLLKNLLRTTAALLVSCILAALGLAAIVACQSPKAVPTVAPPTEALLLSGLPEERSAVAFLEFGRISQRPSLGGQGAGVDLMSLVYATNEILGEQLVRSAGITSAAFSINSYSEGAAILLGDFHAFPAVLRRRRRARRTSLPIGDWNCLRSPGMTTCTWPCRTPAPCSWP